MLAPGCRIRCTVTFVTEQRSDAPNPWLDETTAARLVMLPLACLAKEFPWKASEVLDERLDRRAVAAEIEVIAQEENRDFECPYGWA
jgi:hypothetical protein